MMNHTGSERPTPRQPTGLLLQNSIRRFLLKRSIEVASAASLVALTSFSQSYALTVGELNVSSALGQPLRATLNVTTAPGEYFGQRCVRLTSPDAGMPGIDGLSLTVTTTLNRSVLQLSGRTPMREPMSEIVVKIDCAGTPQLTRSFLVMLDPPTASATYVPPLPATRPARASITAPVPSAARRATPRAAAARSNRPIDAGSRYVVRPGDILSVIAERVAGRPEYSVWPIAQRIFETNPAAFDGSDPNTLRVGAEITIPRLTGRLAVDNSPNQTRAVVSNATPALPREAIVAAAKEALLRNEQALAPARPEPVAVREPVVRKMRYARTLSGLSMDRLRQRRSGEIMVAPTAVANTSDATPAVVAAAPAPRVEQSVVRQAAPVVQPRVQVITRPRHWVFSALWAAAGLLAGGLLTMFSMRAWLSRQRSEQEDELARAKRHQARLDESRKTRTDDKPPSIVVHEELPRVDIGGAGVVGGRIETVGSMQEVLATHVAISGDDPEPEPTGDLEEDSDSTTEAASLSVDSLDPADDLDFDVFDAPNETDLEMLAQDYAQSSGDVRSLEPGLNIKHLSPDTVLDMEETMAMMLTPEQLGVASKETQIMEASLDLELPEAHPDDTELALRELERQVTVDLDEELTQTAIKLDADLLNVDHALLPADVDPTQEAEALDVLEQDSNVIDDDPTSSIQTRDTEDFYHLEASSIRQIGDLAFESELEEDESKILSFRRQDKSGGASS
ncbi:MAG: FimV family protein [Gammaproteobacteria bacterium]